MNHLKEIQSALQASIQRPTNARAYFYKTGPGEYAEHDQFIGVNVPTLRAIAKNFQYLELTTVQILIASKINEERLLALFILTTQYKKAHKDKKPALYNFYMQNLQHINNWNLVDSSAHLILGAHIKNADKTILNELAKSQKMWERRIAIVATWAFIRSDDLEWTFKIAELLFNDPHDLIHKAAGWMLREAGKKDLAKLITFLEIHAAHMPRTMLRYAIEKFPDAQRRTFLSTRKHVDAQ